MPQFDSTIIGRPYSKVLDINIDYKGSRYAIVTQVTQRYVPLDNGTHEPLGSSESHRFEITPEVLKGTVPLRDIDTGELLGQDMPMEHIFLGVNAVVRQQEVLKELPEPVVEAAQPE